MVAVSIEHGGNVGLDRGLVKDSTERRLRDSERQSEDGLRRGADGGQTQALPLRAVSARPP